MLKIEEVKIVLKGELDNSYKNRLDRLFFFNQNQHKYEERIVQAIKEYSIPVLKEKKGKVSIVFRDEWKGQTLHVLDSEEPDGELIGVVMYSRDSDKMVTIVHMALHEGCNTILKDSKINIALIILDRIMQVFKKMKGIQKVRIYYTEKTFRI